MHLQAALDAFLLQLQADGRSRHTTAQYARHTRSLIDWLTMNRRSLKLAAITPTTVAEFFSSDAARNSARGGPKRATSANAQRTSLRCFFRWAHESGLTPNNAARLLRRARCAPPPPRALHDDEQQRLRDVLAAATGPEAARDRMLVELLLGTGIRIGSALALDVEDIDFAHAELALRRTKGDRPATAILPAGVATRLKVFVGKRIAGPLFLAGDRRVSMRHAQRRLAGWLAKARIAGRSAHSLRHAFALEVYGKTGDLLLTQVALGHASVSSTVCYAKVDRARLREVVGA
jgi:integrase/recombinase XerC